MIRCFWTISLILCIYCHFGCPANCSLDLDFSLNLSICLRNCFSMVADIYSCLLFALICSISYLLLLNFSIFYFFSIFTTFSIFYWLYLLSNTIFIPIFIFSILSIFILSICYFYLYFYLYNGFFSNYVYDFDGEPTVEKEFDFVNFSCYFGDYGFVFRLAGLETVGISFGSFRPLCFFSRDCSYALEISFD